MFDELKTTILPSKISGKMPNVRVTRFGQKLFGLPVTPRPSRGFRKHVRQMKAESNGH